MRGIKKTGGESVGPGSYWHVADGNYLHLDEGGVLPGGSADVYFRVPVFAMVFIAPILGLVYALFLPFIGLAMLFGLVGKKVVLGIAPKAGELGKDLADNVSRVATFGWRPSEAYFNGRRKDEDAEDEGESSPEDED